ncbi:MAG: hypothetical protein QFB87_02260 [Patescibacteria group bacterium]|nr:hypothetical protein [Patescibacteria group bacterium]
MSDAPAEQPHKIIEESGPVTQHETEQNETAAEFGSKTIDGKLSMSVKIHSPFKTYYEGDAFSISGENATGPFDILPTHHNFISLLNPCELVVRSPKGDERIIIAGGLMHVKSDKVVVFLDV